MKIWSLLNHKGGVGKTTATINISYTLANLGKRVLVIDMDPQANTSSIFKEDYESASPSLSDLFANKSFDINKAISQARINGTEVDNLFIVHSNSLLEQALINIPQRTRRETILAKSLERLGYDYVLIDCPPSIGEGVLNAVYTSDKVIVPVELDGFAVNSISNMFDLITETKDFDDVAEMLESGVVSFFVNKYDARSTVLNEKIGEELQVIKPYFIKRTCKSRSDIRKAIDAKMPVALYSPKSDSAEDYQVITYALVEGSNHV
ncbi:MULTISPECIES: ParA family protein [unclassified Marinobacterium]|uniref:ParA family protein n=1 Tax=unclassified Marinobacterium TaxID=2644139 RepID=UPI001568A146|nr:MULTISPECIES: ParA family protein [unclassified Marinobacterium]NRP10997.1 Sporulation initiation inhibitor protein Soj [Marinobacterium sp. xm-g-48]NRP83841.1 Sporulation initiation inhibitor protein Soj [Marinobacterium sp. xm-d-509]